MQEGGRDLRLKPYRLASLATYASQGESAVSAVFLHENLISNTLHTSKFDTLPQYFPHRS